MLRDMPGRLVPPLLLGISATMTGIAVGYYVAMTGGLPISESVLVIIGLLFVALLTAFHGGRSRKAAEAQPPSFSESWDAFRRELDRSRRFGRQFVLMRIPAGETLRATGGSVSAARGPLGAMPLALRAIDQAWTMEGSVYAVLPESNRPAAMALIARLRASMPDAASLDEIEIAEFPEDGLTTGALVASLRAAPVPGEVPPVRLVPAGDAADRRHDQRTG